MLNSGKDMTTNKKEEMKDDVAEALQGLWEVHQSLTGALAGKGLSEADAREDTSETLTVLQDAADLLGNAVSASNRASLNMFSNAQGMEDKLHTLKVLSEGIVEVSMFAELTNAPALSSKSKQEQSEQFEARRLAVTT